MARDYQVAGVVMFYMVAALVMVFVNKIVLNSAPNLAILFMFFQSAMTVLLLHVSALISPAHIQLPSINLRTARTLAPLLLVHAAGFLFNALCLRDVDATFFQIARGLMLPLTIIASTLALGVQPSLIDCAAASIVSSGFFVGAKPSIAVPAGARVATLGLLYGFLSSLAGALHAVLIKASLPAVKGSAIHLAYWHNLASMIFLALTAVLTGEVADFAGMVSGGDWDWRTFAWGNIVTGTVGFTLSVAGILSVKVTSPVTHMFSSAARSVLQVFIGVRLFGDALTTQRILSLFMILTGTLLYTWNKSRSQPPPKTADSAPPSPSAVPLLSEKDLEANESKEAAYT